MIAIGDNVDERVNVIREEIRRSSLAPAIRAAAEDAVTRVCGQAWCTPEKDTGAEVSAIFDALRDPTSPIAVRYTLDRYPSPAYEGGPIVGDQFSTAESTLRRHAGDCFVQGTKVLRREGHALVPVEALRVGDEVWGYTRWSKVTRVWGDKGVLPTWKVRLNNGSSMRLTPDHKVWALHCERHATRTEKSAPCSCRPAERQLMRVHVRDLRADMVVTQPERIDFGTGKMDGDHAWMDGVYLADGWSESCRFAISGQDGQPKEVQKRRVEAICQRLGIPTRWHRKYLAINDKVWASRMASMGARAPQKRALSIDLDEGGALPLLEGIMADSGQNSSRGRTFTTTSRALWLQTRVLLKMAGRTASERYIVDHGGLGENPIWRLGVRDPNPDGRDAKLLRVVEVVRDDVALPCWDIETDDHFMWLPEADWTTSQCDDSAIALGALLLSIGHPVKCRIVQTVGARSWNHIYLLSSLTPGDPDASWGTRAAWTPEQGWVALDPTEPHPAGWEVHGADRVASTGRPAGVVIAVRDYPV